MIGAYHKRLVHADRRVQAEAALRTAQLNLSRCLIRAPQAGIVSRRTIQLGETLAAKQPFLISSKPPIPRTPT